MEENQEKSAIKSVPKGLGYIFSMGFLFLILGLIISTQFQSYTAMKKSGIPATRQINELVLILKQAQNKKSDLEKQLSQVKIQLQEMKNNRYSRSLTSSQVQKIHAIAGLTPVNGDGIVIKLKEEKSYNKGVTENLIHSDDLLKIVNELKSSGAKAISVNNQRLITISEIVTAGNNIVVNQKKLIPPYEIKAIGPADTMYSALKIRGGIIEYIEVFGIKTEILKQNKIEIPAYNGDF